MVRVSDPTASPSGPPDAGSEGAHPLLSLALAGMMDDVGAHAGAVYLLSPEDAVLEMAVMAGLPRAFAAPWERVALTSPVPVADAVRERRLVWVGGEEDMARRYPRIAVVLPYPFAVAALPVARADTVYGAVFVTWPGSHSPEPSDAEHAALLAACDRLALRLERAAKAGRPVHPEADFLGPSAMAGTTGAAEAAQMAARIPDGLCALDVDGRVTYANPAAAELLGRPARELLGGKPWNTLPWLNDPVYEDRYRGAMISQHPVSFTALRPPQDWLTFRLYPSRSGLSVLISPARGTGRDKPAAEAGRHRAGLVAITHLLTLASALTEAVSVTDVIDLVADEVMPAVGSRTLVVLVPEAGRLRVLGHRGYPDPSLAEHYDGIPLSAPRPSAQALATGVPSFFETREKLEAIYPARVATPDGMAAWAFLPLIASGRPVGTCILGYTEPHRFADEERAVLTSLGGLVAQALERARLYDAKNRLAHGLQSALLPHSLPRLPGLEVAARYLPGTQGMDIGGDFYDLIRTAPDGEQTPVAAAPSPGDGRGRAAPTRPQAGPAPAGPARRATGVQAAAVIGDVQGHNVTAAGLMGQVRTAVRAYTAVGQQPGTVMASTNLLLIGLDVDLLASCAYLHLDLPRHRALLARAGHPQPLLRAPDGTVHVLDLPGGPLLGVDPTAVYPTSAVPMSPGSVLVLYTDGLIEAPGVDLDAALAQVADRLERNGDRPLEELADHLIEGKAAGPRDRGDDTALLLLRPNR
ncbi:SpoIIE family protein phosphatase [Streptomyces chengmaiensis]